MKQLCLFDDSNHLAIVREILDRTPDFGPGDHIYVADGGATECIIDKLVEEAGALIYECHTDSLFPVQMYLTREEIFSSKELKRCREKWEEMEERFFTKFNPKDIGIEKCVSFNLAFPKPVFGKRIGNATVAVLSNGFIYEETFGQPAMVKKVDEPFEYLDKFAAEIKTLAQEKKAMCLKHENPDFKDIYEYNGTYMSWDGIRYKIPDLRNLRVG